MTDRYKVSYKDDHSNVVEAGKNPAKIVAQFWGDDHASEAYDYVEQKNAQTIREGCYAGKLRFGAYSGTGKRCFVELADVLSGNCVVQVELTRRAFAEALFNAEVDCQFQIYHFDRIGMKRIHNRVKLKTTEYKPDVGSRGYLALTEQLQPLLDEGWDFRNDDLENGHNYHRDGEGNYTVDVHTWKYVDPESDEAKEWEAAQAAKETARRGARKGKKRKQKKG